MLSGLFSKLRLPHTAVLMAALAVLVAAMLACGESHTPVPTSDPTSPPATPMVSAPAADDELALPTGEQLGGGSPDLFIQVFDEGRAGSSFRPTSEFASAAQPLAEGEKLKVGIIFVGSQQDLGWNQAAASGADYLEQVFDDVEVLRAENIPETAEVQAVAEQMIEQGATIVIPTSFGYSDPTKAILDKHPEVMFLHLGDLEIFENYGSFFANIWQLEYAAGRAAGTVTKSNKLGFIAAFPSPVQPAEHQRLPPGGAVGQPRRGDHRRLHQRLVRPRQAGDRRQDPDRRRY